MKPTLPLTVYVAAFALACSTSENSREKAELDDAGGGRASESAGSSSSAGVASTSTGGRAVGGTSSTGGRSVGGNRATGGTLGAGGTGAGGSRSTGGASGGLGSTGGTAADGDTGEASRVEGDPGCGNGTPDSGPPDCATEWVRQFGGPNGDGARAVAADRDGSSYVAGVVGGEVAGGPALSGGSFDAYVRKFGANGVVLWTRQFGSAGDDAADSVAVDANANVYVAGSVGGALPGQTASGFWDVFVRKYDSSGNELWTRQFGSGGYDTGRVTADANGNVIVSGITESGLPSDGQGDAAGTDGVDAGAVGYVFVRKYDGAGTVLWTRQFGSTGEQINGSANVAGSAKADSAGNVYFAGLTDGTLPGQTSSGGEDAFLRKYDPAGTELWTRQFGTSASDAGRALAADQLGNVYVVGNTFGAFPGQTGSGMSDAFVRKFDGGGTAVWTRQFGTGAPDGATAVQVDASGVVYVGGTTSGTLPGHTSAGSTDAFVRKYDGTGAELGTRQFGTVAIEQDISLSVGPRSLYVAGQTNGSFRPNQGGFDAFLLELTR